MFVSSISAFSPGAPLGMYAVSKTALVGLTKALAQELAPRGIRVNCIAPGTRTAYAASRGRARIQHRGFLTCIAHKACDRLPLQEHAVSLLHSTEGPLHKVAARRP